jgi:23S rRNA pseudouridine2604 synthase
MDKKKIPKKHSKKSASNKKNEGLRINKYLADQGLCSRREADALIEKGWIRVNGEVLKELGYKVLPKDKVEWDEKAEKQIKNKKTIIIHKPLGYVSAQAEDGYQPAIRLATAENYYGDLKHPKIFHKGFAPAGRLDIDSTGLLILTQNGKIAKNIISPQSVVEKEYVVLVNGEITQEKVNKLCFGLSLDGKKLKRAKVKKEEAQKLRFILIEGKKRQIRRMCEQVDLEVTSLKRVRIGRLRLGKLPLGKWRFLKDSEKIF